MPKIYTDDFSRAQDVSTGSDVGIPSTYCMALNGAKILGIGTPVFVESHVDTTFVGSSKPLDIYVGFGADAAGFTSSPTVVGPPIMQIPTVTPANTNQCAALPQVAVPDGMTVWGFVYKGPNGALSTGAITVGLTLEPGRDTTVPRAEVNIG